MKKLIPTKFGADPKKLAILVGLFVVAGYFYFSGRSSSDTAAVTRPATGGSSPVPSVSRSTPRPGVRTRAAQRGTANATREFRPSFKVKDIDPSAVDPTLHLTLLTKLKDVKVEGNSRSLFDISNAPPVEIAKIKEPAKIKPSPVGPMPPPPPAAPPPPPKAPPIPLKFYGFVNPNKSGAKRAFFLHNEDIIIASEGEVIEKRYKIVRIGVNSAIVEDTEFKENNQQTLPLEAEMAG